MWKVWLRRNLNSLLLKFTNMEEVVALRALVLAQQELIAQLRKDLTYTCDNHCLLSATCSGCEQRICSICDKKCYWQNANLHQAAFCKSCAQKEFAIFECTVCPYKNEYCPICLKEKKLPCYCNLCGNPFKRIN